MKSKGLTPLNALRVTLEQRADLRNGPKWRRGLKLIRQAAAGRQCGTCVHAPPGSLGLCGLHSFEVKTPFAVACPDHVEFKS